MFLWILSIGSALIFESHHERDMCLTLYPAVYKISVTPIAPTTTVVSLVIHQGNSLFTLPVTGDGFLQRQINKTTAELCWRTNEPSRIQVDIYSVEGARRLIEKKEMSAMMKEIDRTTSSVMELYEKNKRISIIEHMNGAKIDEFDGKIKFVQGSKLLILALCVGMQIWVLRKMLQKSSTAYQSV